MGGGHSQERVESFAETLYEIALQKSCLLPDVSLDESLLKYSGLDSNYQLQQFSSQLVGISPGYISRLGSALGSFTTVPNAVGLGALVISMIIEIAIKTAPQKDNSYDMFRRVFGEEKASAVRDTMSEYLKRHRTFLNNNNRIWEELQRQEAELSKQLTQLQNSMLHDGQMSTRGLNIWVNGASFHVLMLIHEARLSIQRGNPSSDYVNAISISIDLYLLELDRLLEKYKSYMSDKTRILTVNGCAVPKCRNIKCKNENTENGCRTFYPTEHNPVDSSGVSSVCGRSEVKEAYMNLVFSTYEPILGLKSHFLNMKTNLNVLINQHDSFTLPSTA